MGLVRTSARAARLLGVLVVVAVWLSWGAHAEARQLYWRELNVTARLDANGQLHVSELQRMVFTGGWNGGERGFRVSGQQVLELDGVSRITPDGAVIPLVAGDLSEKDTYGWAGNHQLRWRSRTPDEPEFADTELAYRLDYRLSFVLDPQGERVFTLDHDFAFPNRPGVIQTLRVHLELDPVWEALNPISHDFHDRDVAPGRSAILHVPLRYTGPGYPQSVLRGATSTGSSLAELPAPEQLRWGLLLGVVALAAGYLQRLLSKADRLGVLSPLPSPAIDRAWLEQHVLSRPPEEVGAAYDRHIGAAEVAAVIARMTAENKLRRVPADEDGGADRGELQLELVVDRASLVGYERELVDRMFVLGHRITRRELRHYYRRTGFIPAASLRRPLRRQLGALFSAEDEGTWRGYVPLLSGALAVVGALLNVLLVGSFKLFAIAMLVAWYAMLGAGVGAWFRSRIAKGVWAAVCLTSWIGLGILGTAIVLLRAPELSTLEALTLALLAVSALLSVLRSAEIPYGIETLALQRRLGAARQYFRRQLAKRDPEIDDAWVPYLIALDLGGDVHRWQLCFGKDVAATRPQGARLAERDSSGSNGGGGAPVGSSRPCPGWTGGGGQFGGAGATGTWVLATEALAAGIHRPGSRRGSSSSSSSSGWSSSGSSRSGGGSGGGW